MGGGEAGGVSATGPVEGDEGSGTRGEVWMEAAEPAWLRRLGWWWLRELDAAAVEALRKDGEGGDDPRCVALWAALAETLGTEAATTDPAPLDRLAAEHHRLLGFAVPPYESVFVDPSAMMMAPASARPAAIYARLGWRVPTDARAGAPDHLGLELLALAEALTLERWTEARALLLDHVALWAPSFLEGLGRARPTPFYAALAEVTLEAMMVLLCAWAPERAEDEAREVSFPSLPPPPRYRGTGMALPDPTTGSLEVGHGGIVEEDEGASGDFRLRDLVSRLLSPRQAGLWLGRADAMQLSGHLGLPSAIGNRAAMIEAMLRAAGGQDAAPEGLRRPPRAPRRRRRSLRGLVRALAGVAALRAGVAGAAGEDAGAGGRMARCDRELSVGRWVSC